MNSGGLGEEDLGNLSISCHTVHSIFTSSHSLDHLPYSRYHTFTPSSSILAASLRFEYTLGMLYEADTAFITPSHVGFEAW